MNYYKLGFGLVSFAVAFLLFLNITLYELSQEQNEMISSYKDYICFLQQEKLGMQNCTIPSVDRVQEILNFEAKD